MLAKTLSDGFAVECWNPSGRINDLKVQDEILSTNPDIAVFPEAAHENVGIQTETTRRFEEAGYKIHYASYDGDDDESDADGWRDRRILAMIAKPQHIVDVRQPRLGGCPALLARLQGGADLLAFQLDSSARQLRLLQAKRVVHLLGETALAVGVTSAFYNDSLQSRLLDRLTPRIQRLPSVKPGNENPSRFERFGGRAQQLARFVDGVTMKAFSDAGFKDANESRLPAMYKELLGADTQRILYRGHIEAIAPTQMNKVDGLWGCWRTRATLAHLVRY